uniref:Uncharacterized protein n=1 Tax=Klebsiella pneumoniae TaxID=573 RepID=A0A6G9HNB8_KLEPN|nr:hypothetical protein [Klebsiella pneumoniae]
MGQWRSPGSRVDIRLPCDDLKPPPRHVALAAYRPMMLPSVNRTTWATPKLIYIYRLTGWAVALAVIASPRTCRYDTHDSRTLWITGPIECGDFHPLIINRSPGGF